MIFDHPSNADSVRPIAMAIDPADGTRICQFWGLHAYGFFSRWPRRPEAAEVTWNGASARTSCRRWRVCRGRGAPGYAGGLAGVVQGNSRGCTIVMPAHRRQPFGLVALTGLGLVAGLLAAGCTSPSPARHQPGAHPRVGAATRIAVPAGPGGVDVRAENARPGYPGWRITSPGQPQEIEGYTDHASAPPGTVVRLFGSTTAAWFRVRALRFGWYGGTLARLVWTSAQIRGTRQPAAVVLVHRVAVAGAVAQLTKLAEVNGADMAVGGGGFLLEGHGDHHQTAGNPERLAEFCRANDCERRWMPVVNGRWPSHTATAWCSPAPTVPARLTQTASSPPLSAP